LQANTNRKRDFIEGGSEIHSLPLFICIKQKAMKRASKRGSLELRIAGSMKKIFNLYMY